MRLSVHPTSRSYERRRRSAAPRLQSSVQCGSAVREKGRLRLSYLAALPRRACMRCSRTTRPCGAFAVGEDALLLGRRSATFPLITRIVITVCRMSHVVKGFYPAANIHRIKVKYADAEQARRL